MRPTTLHLPYPISANDFMGSFVPKGHKRPIPYVTPAAKAYKNECGWVAKAAGFRKPTAKPIALRVIHHHRATIQDGPKRGQKNGHVYDLDNVLKVTIDGLKKIVYEDDRQIKKILASYGEPTEKGGLTVTVEEWVAPPAELFVACGAAEALYWKWERGEVIDLRSAMIELDGRFAT